VDIPQTLHSFVFPCQYPSSAKTLAMWISEHANALIAPQEFALNCEKNFNAKNGCQNLAQDQLL